jgi:ABC-type hemin transport system ATPase subunit
MKITRIQSENILGVQNIDVHLATPVALFAGRNGSGKSSLQEAVRMAITQDNVRDITTKKTFGALVHEGAKAGGAVVTIDNDSEKSFAFNMPKGEFVGPEISEPMRVALYGQRFARMSTDERRTFLFGLTKLKASAATVKPRMLSEKWGCDEAKVDAVLPLLRTGFPGVCDHAKSKATEAKGSWRQLTGETYGAVKAQTWEAPLPELPEGDLVALAETVAGYDKNIAKLNESLGAIKSTARQAAETAARRAGLADAAGKVPGLAEQLELAKQELADYEPTVEALRQRAAGAARVGLVHEMAMFIATTDIPALGSDAEEKALDLVRRYEAEHGKLEDAAAVDAEAQAALPGHERELTAMRNRVSTLQRDLDSATQAKGQFDALAPAADAIDASAEIAEIEGMLASAKQGRAAAEAQRLDIEAAKKARTAAQDKTKAAAAAHADVEAWTKVASALAPDGIPSEMLAEALAPVNAALEQAAIDTDWMQVVIGSDMSITAADRAYNLLSESEQWRVDAMIAQVVAELSGIKILMLDRVDVLDLPGRAQLLEWVDSLAYHNVIDTALLFGTFKALPEGLADTVTSYWIENGKVAATSTAPQQAAA